MIYPPLKVHLGFFGLTLFLYLFGPVDFELHNTPYLLALLALYQAAFCFGYWFAAKRHGRLGVASASVNVDDLSSSVARHKLSLSVACFLFGYVVFDLLIYTNNGAFRLDDMMLRLSLAFVDPLATYQASFERGRFSTAAMWLLVLMAPLYYLALAKMCLSLPNMTRMQKVFFVSMVLLICLKWLLLGRNKGVFDTLLLLVLVYSFFLVGRRGSDISPVKWPRKVLYGVVVLILISAALSYFENVLVSRKAAYEFYSRFDHMWLMQIMPESLKPLIVNLTAYLASGYRALAYSIDVSWTPMFGIGHSSVLIQNASSLLGEDLFQHTLQAQLEVYGIDKYVNWHTAYVWFANDLHWSGVIPLMSLIGYQFAAAWIRLQVRKRAIDFAVFYLLCLMLAYFSANAQIFSQTASLVSFWVLLVAARLKPITL